jgi:hypothetical protein
MRAQLPHDDQCGVDEMVTTGTGTSATYIYVYLAIVLATTSTYLYKLIFMINRRGS